MGGERHFNRSGCGNDCEGALVLQLPEHGGDLGWARANFPSVGGHWLDLSTGISPWAWPVDHWPQQVFRALPPQLLQPLEVAAARYYGCASESLQPVPGSQYAISRLPVYAKLGTVALPAIGYHEHARAWQQAGHQPRYYRSIADLMQWAEQGLVHNAVIINPNNPSGVGASRTELLSIQQNLLRTTHNRGLLLVDEAFMDVQPGQSLAPLALQNTIVLRSFGKFFGLAGLRLGFVIDQSGCVLEELKRHAGPWLISHPAVWAAQQALQDEQWIALQRRRIIASNKQLRELLQAYLQSQGWACQCGGHALFVTLTASAAPLYQLFVRLAEQGILTRFGQVDTQQAWLRFGLATDYKRLQNALSAIESIGDGE